MEIVWLAEQGAGWANRAIYQRELAHILFTHLNPTSISSVATVQTNVFVKNQYSVRSKIVIIIIIIIFDKVDDTKNWGVI